MNISFLENQAKIAQEKHNFRKAKDCYKELCKTNKAKYMPDLIRSYEGLANQMIEKKQISEAKTIFDYLKQLTGKDYQKEVISLNLNNKSASNDIINLIIQSDNSLKYDEFSHPIDFLVISFVDYPELEINKPTIYKELKNIRQALELISFEKYTQASEVVYEIGIHSIFFFWKLFIKGLIAFYTKEDEKVLSVFKKLKPKTLLHEAFAPYNYLIENKFTQTNEEFYKKVALVSGFSNYANFLPRVQMSWQTKNFENSYNLLKASISNFPSEDSGFNYNLTLLFFNFPFHMSHEESYDYYKNVIDKLIYKVKDLFTIERLIAIKALFIHINSVTSHNEDCKEFEWIIKEFILLNEKIHGKNLRFESILYFVLGKQYAKECSDTDHYLFFEPKKTKEIYDERKALEFLRKSIESFNNLEAHLKVLEVFEKTNQINKYNKHDLSTDNKC